MSIKEGKMIHEKRLHKELRKVNKELDSISDSIPGDEKISSNVSSYLIYILVFAFVAVCAIALFHFRGDLAGFLVLGMESSAADTAISDKNIIDFYMEPESIGIDYWQEPVKIIYLNIKSEERSAFNVLLSLEGPLSSSFSWQGSLIHMTPSEPEKKIPITMILPDNLPKGTYTHKITAIYLPEGIVDSEKGDPVAKSVITITKD